MNKKTIFNNIIALMLFLFILITLSSLSSNVVYSSEDVIDDAYAIANDENMVVEETVEIESEVQDIATETIVVDNAAENEIIADIVEESDETENAAVENDENAEPKHKLLTIPSAEITCQLNDVDSTLPEASYLAQYYTDMEDSAVVFKKNKAYVVADHNTQAFATLQNVKFGDSATIEMDNGEVITIKCFRTGYGFINGAKFTSEGIDPTSYGGYVLYTYSDKKPKCDVFLTYWSVVEEPAE